ncbi:hypothetical protein MMC30_003799 [Trapelia coarctata]|nr:hypothetical protein [Trapelia coarctata]
MAFSPENQLIQPAQYGGYGQDAKQIYGGLEGREFNSRCPPEVTKDSVIIAVLGPNDWNSNASPQQDGFFISDFYMFHHLFRETAKTQHWLSCMKPQQLVAKYSEYAHGNKIVLDKALLGEVQDILIYPPKELLERFYSCVMNACKDTKGTGKPILVLVFGHGIRSTKSVIVGGSGPHTSCDLMTIAKFREAILRSGANPKVTLLTTSCYGGGWAQSTALNITALAAVNERQEALSWPNSDSLGRYCGSRYATSVANSLIKAELGELSSEVRETVRSMPTYAELVKVIHDTLLKEVDLRPNNSISFAAQDDVWDKEWKNRTGIPMSKYQQKWDMLKSVPKGPTGRDFAAASVRFSNELLLSSEEASHRLLPLVAEYHQSLPGDASSPKNHEVESLCRRLVLGQSMSDGDLELLAGTIRYRMEHVMGRATMYKDHLEVSFVDCSAFDNDEYQGRLNNDPKKAFKWSQIDGVVSHEQLFDEPEVHEGLVFEKGNEYVVAMLTESGWNRERVEEAVKELARMSVLLSAAYRTQRKYEFGRAASVREKLKAIVQRTKGRLRSLSPSKHERKSLDAAFEGLQLTRPH